MRSLLADHRLGLRHGTDVRRRRLALSMAAISLATLGRHVVASTQPEPEPGPRWYQAALDMKRLAESWGDQPYGAVLVKDGALLGEGPSRVVRNRDPSAHAEREALRDAQRRLGAERLSGSVLYSTSRPCSLCEAAAARAGVRRMYFGPGLADAGAPAAPER
jgi:tRNA(Arg) A34 adenosine deaminase TadA